MSSEPMRPIMRNRTISLLLILTAAIQAAPVTAGPAACPMGRVPVAQRCRSCAVAPVPDAEPGVSAASCCRFGVAPETSTAPGVVPSLASHDGMSLAAASPAPALVSQPRPAAAVPAAGARLRSSGTPLSLLTSLRL
jgi:hypothetical protein